MQNQKSFAETPIAKKNYTIFQSNLEAHSTSVAASNFRSLPAGNTMPIQATPFGETDSDKDLV